MQSLIAALTIAATFIAGISLAATGAPIGVSLLLTYGLGAIAMLFVARIRPNDQPTTETATNPNLAHGRVIDVVPADSSHIVLLLEVELPNGRRFQGHVPAADARAIGSELSVIVDPLNPRQLAVA